MKVPTLVLLGGGAIKKYAMAIKRNLNIMSYEKKENEREKQRITLTEDLLISWLPPVPEPP